MNDFNNADHSGVILSQFVRRAGQTQALTVVKYFVMLARMSKEAERYLASTSHQPTPKTPQYVQSDEVPGLGEKIQASRRSFIRQAAISAGALGLGGSVAKSAEQTVGIGKPMASKMRLGLVTYNLAKDWDVATIIRNCEQTGFEGVELRTTHAHGVEVTLTKVQRDEVRRRFQDSKVVLMGLGSAFDYHTPDQAKLKKDIEATKEYIILAHDVGASGIKVRPNALPREVPVEKTLEQIGRALRELGEFADGYGQQIRLEVHGSGTSLLPRIRTIIDVADHKNVGVCWNSNQTDLEGQGFDYNFDLVRHKIFEVHMRDLYLEEYPWRKLMTRLNEIGYAGFCLAEISESNDPIRVMRYYRALWLALQQPGGRAA